MNKFLAAVLVSLLAFPAVAQECREEGEMVPLFQQENPQAQHVLTLRGQEALDFVANLNEMPPVSDVKGDVVIMWGHPQAPMFYVLLFNGGCLTEHGPVSPENIPLLLRKRGV